MSSGLSSPELSVCLQLEVLPVNVEALVGAGVPFDVAVRAVTAWGPDAWGVDVLDAGAVARFASLLGVPALRAGLWPSDVLAGVCAVMVRVRDGLFSAWSVDQAGVLVGAMARSGELDAGQLAVLLRAGSPDVVLPLLDASMGFEDVFTVVALSRRGFDVDDGLWLVSRGVTRASALTRDLTGFSDVPDRLERRYAVLLGVHCRLDASAAHALVVAVPDGARDLLVALVADGMLLPDAVRASVAEAQLAARQARVPASGQSSGRGR